MDEQATVETKKPAKAGLMDPKKLAMFAAIALVLASVLTFLPTVISVLEVNNNAGVRMASSLANIIRDLLCSLILPLGLFLLTTSNQKKYLGKIFLIVAGVFLVVQLISVLVMAINAITGNSAGVLVSLLQYVCGGGLLAGLVNAIKTLINGDLRFVTGLLLLLRTIIFSAGELFYILANGICAFGFYKLISKK